MRAQREREKQVSETNAEEERRELESESTSLSVRFKGENCEAVMNREIEVRYGQVVVTSEQEPAIWDVVDESATQATNTRRLMCRKGTWCGGESLGGSGLKMDHTCEKQGADEERGVQPPELPKRQSGRKGGKIRCNENALHLVLHLPPNASATASAAAAASATMRSQWPADKVVEKTAASDRKEDCCRG